MVPIASLLGPQHSGLEFYIIRWFLGLVPLLSTLGGGWSNVQDNSCILQDVAQKPWRVLCEKLRATEVVASTADQQVVLLVTSSRGSDAESVAD